MLAPRHHPHLLQPDNALILVVDMQESFLKSIFEADRLVENVNKLIRGANILRIPVISTVQNRKALGEVIPTVKTLLPALLPPFDKMTFNCFANAGIASEIARSGRKQIILCGMETHICISQTALGLTAASHQVHVAADAVSSRTHENWQGGLNRMRQSGVFVTSVEAALYELLHEAGTADFRDILAIIK